MQYTFVIEAVKKLYENGDVSKENIDEKLDKKMITQEEYDYIIGKEDEE